MVVRLIILIDVCVLIVEFIRLISCCFIVLEIEVWMCFLSVVSSFG